jgi:hypothetical protein
MVLENLHLGTLYIFTKFLPDRISNMAVVIIFLPMAIEGG